MTANEALQLTVRRLALYIPDHEKKKLVAKLKLQQADDGSITVEMNCTDKQKAEQLTQILSLACDRRLAAPIASIGKELEQAQKILSGMLVEVGYDVEELPVGDVQITFELDLRSGLKLGSASPLHDFNEINDEAIAKQVFQAVAGVTDRISNDTADALERSIATADPAEIIATIRASAEKGAFIMAPTRRLLNALLQVDVDLIDVSERKLVHESRLCVAHLLKNWNQTGKEAERLLRDYGDQYEELQRNDLQMELANAAIQNGQRETALLIWRRLLRTPERLEAGNRGWAWSNLALALPDGDPEMRHAAKCSADAFLEAGDKRAASISLMMLANAQLFEEPQKALDTIGNIFEIIDGKGLSDRALMAATFHARGNRLQQMGAHAAAADDAEKAIEQLRGLMGAENELISALHLASLAYRSTGDTDRATVYDSEARLLTEETGSAHFTLASRVEALLASFDPSAAEQLLRDAERAGNREVAAMVPVARSIGDTTLDDLQRIALIEDSLGELDRTNAPARLKQPGRTALANLLARVDEPLRAEVWYEKILETDPFDTNALNALLQSLWNREHWGDAALVLRHQLDLRGERPGLLFAYGRSLFEAGDYSGAIPPLSRTINLADDQELAERARELRELALDKGGTVAPKPSEKPFFSAVTREEFDLALDAFAAFVSSEKRMRFWTKKDGQYVWVEGPEKRAQDLLHTFLKARFLDRIHLFEELDSGAGRLDLYVRLAGGLNLIVELKMCGFNYSSNYAAAGETQLLHYMRNRDSMLGYLAVFDARLTMNGEPLLTAEGSATISSKFVDMRPRVSSSAR